MTSAFTLCGRRDAYSTGLALVARLVPVGAAAVCVAGVAFGLVSWAFILCGRRGTYGTRLPLVARVGCVGVVAVFVAGKAYGSIGVHSVWQAWHLVTPTLILSGRRGTHGTGLPLWHAGRRGCLCGRHGIWKHRPPVCVARARVAFGDLDLHSVRQAWRLWHWASSGGALGSRGRRGICVAGVALGGVWKHRPPFCVASAALGDIDRHSVRQAWHTSGGRRGCSCGRRGVWKHRPPFCVAGVAHGHMCL